MKEIIITKGFPLGSHTESRIKSRALDSARLQNPNNQKAQNLQSQNPKAQKKARNLKNILVLGIVKISPCPFLLLVMASGCLLDIYSSTIGHLLQNLLDFARF